MAANTTELEIEGMSCQHCVMTVKKVLGSVPGVSVVDVQVGRAVISTEGPPPRAAITSAIAEEGFRVKDA